MRLKAPTINAAANCSTVTCRFVVFHDAIPSLRRSRFQEGKDELAAIGKIFLFAPKDAVLKCHGSTRK